MRHPRDAFESQQNLEGQWKHYGYTACPDFLKACREYDNYCSLLNDCDIELLFLEDSQDTGIDSIYVRDSSLVTNSGVVLCRMGKPERQAEPDALQRGLSRWSIPVLGEITEPGKLEGGDFLWIDDQTLAVGRGYRTNDEGIAQLKTHTGGFARNVITVHLPHWDGPKGLIHLMSLISPLDHDLAVVYPRLLPVAFHEWLLDHGLDLIDVPDSEFESMGCNILTVAPRKCIMLEGNPRTRARLERAGVEVLTYSGNEISLKGQGGPTCLTRPLLRSSK